VREGRNSGVERLHRIALALSLAAALAPAAPVLAAEMSCRSGASCVDGIGGPRSLLHPVTWFRGVCPRVKADPQRMPCVAAVGRTETQSRSGEVERGSGFVFLHPREFMTSSHGIATDIRVRIRFRLPSGDFNAYGTVVKRGEYYARARANHIQDVTADWAILVIDRPVPGVRPFDGFSGDLDEAPKFAGRISLIGFDIRDDIAYACEACSITGINEYGLMEHDCGASKGTSGGPLMTSRPYGACEVVAMQVIQNPRARNGDAFDGSNGNMAVSGRSFLGDAIRVKDLLDRGLGTVQIKKALSP
jgi:hypothetical protein